jgi:hypothetical protein
MSMISGNSSRIAIPSPVWTLGPGVYFARFSPSKAAVKNAPFSFEIAFRPHFGHDCATAEPILSQGLSSASMKGELLYPEDRQVFRIVINEPWQDPGMDNRATRTTESTIRGPALRRLLERSRISIVRFEWHRHDNCNITGIYYLAIVPEPHTLGSYTLELEWLINRWWDNIL